MLSSQIPDATEARGTLLLLLIRDRVAANWHDLCRVFGLSPDVDATRQGALKHLLAELKAAGLVSFDGEQADNHRDPPTPRGTITLTTHWRRIQSVLGVSLVDIANLDGRHGMVARPRVGLRFKRDRAEDITWVLPSATAQAQ